MHRKAEMSERAARIQAHLEEEHRHGAFAEYLKEIIYGGTDGIVTTFAVVAGFSGATIASETTLSLSFMTVLLFGLANLFADGLSMGLGNFLSVRADHDVYHAAEKKERHEIRHSTEMETMETIDILMEKGYSESDANDLVAILQKNEDYWVDWMMHHELEMANPDGTNPLLTGFATFISFLIFGAIPLIPFMVLPESTSPDYAFTASSIATIFALILLGIFKWRVIGQGLIRSVLEILLVGGTAAGVAYFVGTFFA